MLTHEYLEASKAIWHSTIYDHFDVTLHRDLDGRVQLLTLIFAFNCKIDPTHHTPHLHAQMSTGHGTKNFQDGVRACNKHVSITSTTTPVVNVHEPYSAAAHCTLIAMRCTKNHQPFNSVQGLFSLVLKHSPMISRLFILKCQRMFRIISW